LIIDLAWPHDTKSMKGSKLTRLHPEHRDTPYGQTTIVVFKR
jgi:hypothetical protein